MTYDLTFDARPLTDDSAAESDYDQLSDLQEAPREDRPTPTSRLIGCAGTGKSYTLKQRALADPKYGLLTSTTGISAVNLGAGCATLNATLGYFDTESMRDAFLQGRMTRKLHAIAKQYRNIIVEEYSMLVADQLDLLYRGVEEANRYNDVDSPLGILLVGDLAQLAPVDGKWCFEADYWDRFAASTERLDHVYRQNEGPFLDALNALRVGNGGLAAEYLIAGGATFHSQSDNDFDGTTIFDMNAKVNRHNDMVLSTVPGKRVTVTSRRWGKQRSEWGQSMRTKEWGIPPTQDFKVGALVMLLSNAVDEFGRFRWVNGESGKITAFVPATPHDPEHFIIHMLRTDHEENIYKIVRNVDQSDKPDDWDNGAMKSDYLQYVEKRHYLRTSRRYVTGQIEYYPMRLGYASTCHKSQSLTLDSVQIDYRGTFFGHPGMLYVGLSRCRTLEGLRLVGDKDTLVARCKMDVRVMPWI